MEEGEHIPHHKSEPPGERMVRPLSAATEVARAATAAERAQREENMAKDWQKGETRKGPSDNVELRWQETASGSCSRQAGTVSTVCLFGSHKQPSLPPCVCRDISPREPVGFVSPFILHAL